MARHRLVNQCSLPSQCLAKNSPGPYLRKRSLSLRRDSWTWTTSLFSGFLLNILNLPLGTNSISLMYGRSLFKIQSESSKSSSMIRPELRYRISTKPVSTPVSGSACTLATDQVPADSAALSSFAQSSGLKTLSRTRANLPVYSGKPTAGQSIL